MYQPTLSSATMMNILGNYQANSQFHSVQNQLLYNGSPTSTHQDFQQLNRNSSNYNRRQTQQIPYIPEFFKFHFDPHNLNCGILNGRNTTNWSQQVKSPSNVTPQRIKTISLTPVQSRSSQKQSHEIIKKENQNERNSKRQQDWFVQDSCNSSVSSSSSRSSTPNKHYMGSQTESSDDKDSLSSISEIKIKNKNTKQIKKRGGNIYSSLSTGNLYQEQNQSNKINETSSRIEVQYHNKRKLAAAKNSPKTQRLYKGQKFNSNPHEIKPGNFKYRNSYNPPDKFIHGFHLAHSTEKPKDLLTGSVYDRLSAAIWEKFEQNQLTYANFCHKMYLWKYLTFYISTRFPYYGIHMVGSTLNGFGSNASDVDICLLANDSNMMDNRYEAIIRLEQIMSHLKKSEFIKQLELIHAKVPILKVRDNVYDLHVDLNYNNTVGIRNTHLLYCYSRIDWRVKPLASIIKLWAQCHNINDPRNMTISSYSLILMVIHFLQCGVAPAVLPCLHDLFEEKFHPMSNVYHIQIHEDLKIPSHALTPRNSQTLGELLIEFFRYYNSFDFSRYAISVRVAGKIPIERCRQVLSFKNDFHQWKYLCIEEPFEFTNTARSVYDPTAFEMIKKVINKTYQSLKQSNELHSIFRRIETD